MRAKEYRIKHPFPLRLALLAFLLTATEGCSSLFVDTVTEPTVATSKINAQLAVLVEQAEEALLDARYDEAHNLFSRVLNTDPENVPAKLGLAETFLVIGKQEEALKHFEKLTDVPDAQVRAMQGKGIALLLTNQSEAGREVLQQAAEDDKGLWRTWNALGFYYDSHQQWENARESYNKALSTQLGSPTILSDKLTDIQPESLTVSSDEAPGAQPESSTVSSDEAPGTQPESSPISSNEALDAQPEFSILSYDEALGTQSGPLILHNNLGVSLLLQRKYQEAEEEFIKALELAHDNKIILMNLRLALAWQGKYIESLSGVTQDDLPIVLNNIGYIAMLRGEEASAEAYLLRALEVSPNFLEIAWKNLKYLRLLKDLKSDQKAKPALGSG